MLIQYGMTLFSTVVHVYVGFTWKNYSEFLPNDFLPSDCTTSLFLFTVFHVCIGYIWQHVVFSGSSGQRGSLQKRKRTLPRILKDLPGLRHHIRKT